MKEYKNDEKRIEEEFYPLWFLECGCRTCISLKIQMNIKDKEINEDNNGREDKKEDEDGNRDEDKKEREPRPPLFQSKW